MISFITVVSLTGEVTAFSGTATTLVTLFSSTGDVLILGGSTVLGIGIFATAVAFSPYC